MKRKTLTSLAVTLFGVFALAGVSTGQPFRSGGSTETQDAARRQYARSSEPQKQRPIYMGEDRGRRSKQGSTIVYVEKNRYVVAETPESQGAERLSRTSSEDEDDAPYWPAAKPECCARDPGSPIRTTPIYVEREPTPSKHAGRRTGSAASARQALARSNAKKKPGQAKYKLRPAMNTIKVAPVVQQGPKDKAKSVFLKVPAKTPPPAAKVAGETGGRVVDEISRACENGDVNSCLLLGRMHQTGNGIAKDSVASLRYYTRSCELGNATACYALGVAYEIGNGVPPNVQKARQFYDRSCKGGNAAACENSKRLPPLPAPKKRMFFFF